MNSECVSASKTATDTRTEGEWPMGGRPGGGEEHYCCHDHCRCRHLFSLAHFAWKRCRPPAQCAFSICQSQASVLKRKVSSSLNWMKMNDVDSPSAERKKEEEEKRTNKQPVEMIIIFSVCPRCAFIRIRIHRSAQGRGKCAEQKMTKKQAAAARPRALSSCPMHRLVLRHLHSHALFDFAGVRVATSLRWRWTPFRRIEGNICGHLQRTQFKWTIAFRTRKRGKKRKHDDWRHHHIGKMTPRSSCRRRVPTNYKLLQKAHFSSDAAQCLLCVCVYIRGARCQENNLCRLKTQLKSTTTTIIIKTRALPALDARAREPERM